MEKDRAHNRLYTEKDIGRLIQKATELQQASDSEERGLSFDEIKQLAADLGVDPAYMEQAALDLESEEVFSATPTITGAPFRTHESRVVKGTIDADTWDEVVLQVRNLEGVRGNVSELGKIKEWVYELDGLFSTRVSMRPQENQTTIDIHKDHRGLAFTAYFVSIFLGVTAAGIALDGSGLSDLLTFLLAGSGGVGGLVSVRAALSLWKRNQVKSVKRLASRIIDVLGSTTPPESTKSTTISEPDHTISIEDVPLQEEGKGPLRKPGSFERI